MGSGTSRGKKVAPACVGEVKVTKTTAGVPSPKQDSRPFKPPRSHGILRNARNRAPPDCHSEGHDSDFSREEDDGDGGVDTVLADYEGRGGAPAKKNPPKKIKTYGLCHFSQEDDEDSGSAPRSGAEEPRGSRGGTSDVNNRSVDAFTPARPGLHNGFLTRGALMEAVPASEKQSTFGSCHSSSLTTPVILYDGSEEELMDTIEKEFS